MMPKEEKEVIVYTFLFFFSYNKGREIMIIYYIYSKMYNYFDDINS